MYSLLLGRSLERTFRKLARRNPRQLRAVQSKRGEVLEGPDRYKNLRAPLQHLRRIHIDSSCVLVYSIDEERKAVVVEDYDHHVRAYKR